MTIAELLAQTTRPGPPMSGAQMFLRFWLPILLMFAVFYWVIFRGQKKERQKHEEMLNSLKRNDRVLTIGGVIGTVVDVRGQEIILKVDETNNVKMRFTRSAIKQKLTEDNPAA